MLNQHERELWFIAYKAERSREAPSHTTIGDIVRWAWSMALIAEQFIPNHADDEVMNLD